MIEDMSENNSVDKKRSSSAEKNNRWKAWIVIIFPTIISYVAMIVTTFVHEGRELNGTGGAIFGALLSIVVIIIALLSIGFGVRKGEGLGSRKRKIWFIDALFLLLVNVIAGLIAFVLNSLSLVLILVNTCGHVFIIAHYYFKEIFKLGSEENYNENKEKNKKEKAWECLRLFAFVVVFALSFVGVHFAVRRVADVSEWAIHDIVLGAFSLFYLLSLSFSRLFFDDTIDRMLIKSKQKGMSNKKLK